MQSMDLMTVITTVTMVDMATLMELTGIGIKSLSKQIYISFKNGKYIKGSKTSLCNPKLGDWDDRAGDKAATLARFGEFCLFFIEQIFIIVMECEQQIRRHELAQT